MDKSIEYSAKIASQIQEMFEEDSSNFIDADEFLESDNIKDFLHALASMVPTRLYNKLTGEGLNHLEFNHLANRLCFEKMQLDKRQES